MAGQIYCPNCEEPVPPDSKFCVYCGADQNNCQNCGAGNPPDAKFCATCGVAFVSAAAPPSDTAPSGSPPTWEPPSMSPPESQRTKYQKGALLILALVALVLLVVALSPQPPTYEFKTGFTHPAEINNLMSKKDTVVIHFVLTNCPYCPAMKEKVAGLQSQYPDVAFATFNADDNATSSNMFRAYGIIEVPAIAVIRSDGAVALLRGADIDTNLIKSAIEEAQAWQQSHPTPSSIATPIPTPTADYSSYFTTAFVNGNSIVSQPFTKSTNERGDDVYTGITRNPSASATATTLIELTKSQADAKQLFDQTVAQKLSEGFMLRLDWAAQMRANQPNSSEVWEGQQSNTGQAFGANYYYDSHVASWVFTTEAAPG